MYKGALEKLAFKFDILDLAVESAQIFDFNGKRGGSGIYEGSGIFCSQIKN